MTLKLARIRQVLVLESTLLEVSNQAGRFSNRGHRFVSGQRVQGNSVILKFRLAQMLYSISMLTLSNRVYSILRSWPRLLYPRKQPAIASDSSKHLSSAPFFRPAILCFTKEHVALRHECENHCALRKDSTSTFNTVANCPCASNTRLHRS